MIWTDRTEAGRTLASKVVGDGIRASLVLGLARGGVVVGQEVARALDVPLDVFIVRKIGAPGRPEDAIGAVAPGMTYLNDALIAQLGIGRRYIDLTIEEETRQMDRQLAKFRGGRTPLVRDKAVMLVDDGVATGTTAATAIDWARARGARRVLLAVPVCGPEGAALLREKADMLIYLAMPEDFSTVGSCYADYSPVSDSEISRLVQRR